MEDMTRSSLVALAEQVEQTIFQYQTPGIGLVTVSVRFKESRISAGFISTYEVFTHIAGKEETFHHAEEFLVANMVNKAIKRIEELAENFQIVQRA